MKKKYIVFYMTPEGTGNTEVIVNRKEDFKSIEKIRDAEEQLANELNTSVSITGFQRIGIVWK